jgi:hypothetical protein
MNGVYINKVENGKITITTSNGLYTKPTNTIELKYITELEYLTKSLNDYIKFVKDGR